MRRFSIVVGQGCVEHWVGSTEGNERVGGGENVWCTGKNGYEARVGAGDTTRDHR